jgi:hypothetical protein
MLFLNSQLEHVHSLISHYFRASIKSSAIQALENTCKEQRDGKFFISDYPLKCLEFFAL